MAAIWCVEAGRDEFLLIRAFSEKSVANQNCGGAGGHPYRSLGRGIQRIRTRPFILRAANLRRSPTLITKRSVKKSFTYEKSTCLNCRRNRFACPISFRRGGGL